MFHRLAPLQSKFPFCVLRRFLNSAMLSNPVKVSVKQGTLVGLQRRLPSGLEFQSFQGVPYALPPLGKLRYRSPVPIERFDVPELDCSKDGNISHQKDPLKGKIEGSENCLFLNVYVPKTKQHKPLPVMVWIHGGGYWFGNGNSEYFFPATLMEEEVIVVTLNYRLGALGFLYLPEEGIYGNAGLKDQRLALQWVQENIANFNGDPNNVTIFGESAGGSSVHLHSYSRHAKKLFHKAIMQSGTANMGWVFQSNAATKTRRLAELLGYTPSASSNTSELLDFLQSDKVTPNDILSKTLAVLTVDERRRDLPLTFKPVVEDATSPDSFIDAPIMTLMNEKDRLGNLPLLMGYTSAEGLAFLFYATRNLSIYDNDLARLVPKNLISDLNDPATLKVISNIRDYYFKGGKITDDQLNSLAALFTDYHFNLDMQHAAEIHARNQSSSPLYFYRFDYVGDRNMYKRMFQVEHLHGACHGDELFYLFQMAADDTPVSDDDARMSKRLCQLWANFARNGNPSSDDCKWNPVKRPSGDEDFQLDYLALDRYCEMRQNPDGERVQFWRNMYNSYRPEYYKKLKAKL